VDEDWGWVSNKSGPTRPGLALPLKFFQIEAQFPRNAAGLRAQDRKAAAGAGVRAQLACHATVRGRDPGVEPRC
jgi:hypothetical protein